MLPRTLSDLSDKRKDCSDIRRIHYACVLSESSEIHKTAVKNKKSSKCLTEGNNREMLAFCLESSDSSKQRKHFMYRKVARKGK